MSTAACRLQPMQFQDDIESVLILLAYLLNKLTLPWMNNLQDSVLKVVERRLAPNNNEQLKLTLPQELHDLWSRVTIK